MEKEIELIEHQAPSIVIDQLPQPAELPPTTLARKPRTQRTSRTNCEKVTSDPLSPAQSPLAREKVSHALSPPQSPVVLMPHLHLPPPDMDIRVDTPREILSPDGVIVTITPSCLGVRAVKHNSSARKFKIQRKDVPARREPANTSNYAGRFCDTPAGDMVEPIASIKGDFVAPNDLHHASRHQEKGTSNPFSARTMRVGTVGEVFDAVKTVLPPSPLEPTNFNPIGSSGDTRTDGMTKPIASNKEDFIAHHDLRHALRYQEKAASNPFSARKMHVGTGKDCHDTDKMILPPILPESTICGLVGNAGDAPSESVTEAFATKTGDFVNPKLSDYTLGCQDGTTSRCHSAQKTRVHGGNENSSTFEASLPTHREHSSPDISNDFHDNPAESVTEPSVTQEEDVSISNGSEEDWALEEDTASESSLNIADEDTFTEGDAESIGTTQEDVVMPENSGVLPPITIKEEHKSSLSWLPWWLPICMPRRKTKTPVLKTVTTSHQVSETPGASEASGTSGTSGEEQVVNEPAELNSTGETTPTPESPGAKKARLEEEALAEDEVRRALWNESCKTSKRAYIGRDYRMCFSQVENLPEDQVEEMTSHAK